MYYFCTRAGYETGRYGTTDNAYDRDCPGYAVFKRRHGTLRNVCEFQAPSRRGLVRVHASDCTCLAAIFSGKKTSHGPPGSHCSIMDARRTFATPCGDVGPRRFVNYFFVTFLRRVCAIERPGGARNVRVFHGRVLHDDNAGGNPSAKSARIRQVSRTCVRAPPRAPPDVFRASLTASRRRRPRVAVTSLLVRFRHSAPGVPVPLEYFTYAHTNVRVLTRVVEESGRWRSTTTGIPTERRGDNRVYHRSSVSSYGCRGPVSRPL